MTDSNNFFDNKPVDTTATENIEVEKIAVGDESFTKEELAELVRDGRFKRDVETKHNTKLDRLMPEYTKATQKLSDYERRDQDAATRREQERQAELAKKPIDQLSQEEIKSRALAEADQLGLVSKQNVMTFIHDYMEGAKLIDTVNSVIEDQKTAGNPETTPADLIEYMQKNDFRNPERAYEEMFKVDTKKQAKTREVQEKLNSIKKQPFITNNNRSTAGAKSPAETRLNKDNFGAALSEFFTARKGGEK